MFKSTRYWMRELTRREAAWSRERQELVATICFLAGKPLPDFVEETPEPKFEQLVSALDVLPEEWDAPRSED